MARAPRGGVAWNKLPIEEHLRNGTYRRDRHGPLSWPPTSTAEAPVWAPAESDLAALGDAGRAFVGRLQAVYELSPLDGELATEGAVMADRLAELRLQRAGCADDDERRRLDRLELGWQRALTRCLLALRARL